MVVKRRSHRIMAVAFQVRLRMAVIQIRTPECGSRRPLLRKAKAIAGPRIRHQELRLGRIGFNLFSQPIDEDS
jgi:hypothetical protein